MVSTPTIRTVSLPGASPSFGGRASSLVPFLLGTAVGIAAGTVVGVLLGREIGHAVTDLVIHSDRRHHRPDEPRFEYLLQ